MQFSSLAFAALSLGTGALAQYDYGSGSGSGSSATTSAAPSTSSTASSGSVNVHVVTVGNKDGALAYSPSKLTAAEGDMVQFQFMPANHTVTQSNFDNPCEPLDLHSNLTGVFSGFMPVSKDDTSSPTFTIVVNNTKPMWFYCSQGKHCQNGMSMVINENTKANASRSLEAYQSSAKTVKTNLAPSSPADGTSGTTTTPGTANTTSSGGGSGSGSGSGSSSGGSSSGGSATNSSSKPQSTNSAAGFKVPQTLGLAAILAMGAALFL